MKSIKELLGCSKCGCLILPDSTRCPNCGTSYSKDGEGSAVNNLSFPPKVKLRETGVEAIVAYYQFTCPHHGRIYVKATITTPTLKCPFC